MRKLLPILLASLALLFVSCSTSSGLKEEPGIRSGIYGGDLEKFFRKYENVPHKLGANGPDHFDCSGFVSRAYREVYGVDLPRTSKAQYGKGRPVKRQDLKYGDLVFFNIYGGGVSHVGIYMGKDTFIHASTKLGVTKSDLKTDYYSSRYVGARRILQ